MYIITEFLWTNVTFVCVVGLRGLKGNLKNVGSFLCFLQIVKVSVYNLVSVICLKRITVVNEVKEM